MNCQRVQQLLSMDHDGRSLGNEAGPVTAHVRDCPACRLFQEGLAGFGDRVRTAGEWQPAPRRAIRHRALDRWFTEREGATANRRRPFFLGLPPLVVRPYVLAISSAVVRRWMSGLAGFLNCCGMKELGTLRRISSALAMAPAMPFSPGVSTTSTPKAFSSRRRS